MSEERTIAMPPGVGDLHWIMTKMESFKKKNKIDKIKVLLNLDWLTQMNFHHYSIDYLKLIPFIDSAESVKKPFPFEYALAGGSGFPLLRNIDGCDYIIEFNSLLESGVKLKDILPEYDTNFDYPIEKPPEAEEFAKAVKQTVGDKLVLLFTAALGGNRVWARNLWTVDDWMILARKIYKKTNYRPVLIGAKWDHDYAQVLTKIDTDKIILNMTGKTSLPQLLALLREADLLICFQCGVGMMAVQFRTPTVAFWPIKSRANPHGQLKRVFMRSWIPPWADEVGYMPFGWGDKDATPDGVYEAIGRYL